MRSEVWGTTRIMAARYYDAGKWDTAIDMGNALMQFGSPISGFENDVKLPIVPT